MRGPVAFFPQDRSKLVGYLGSDFAILIPFRDTAKYACRANLPNQPTAPYAVRRLRGCNCRKLPRSAQSFRDLSSCCMPSNKKRR